jgi:transketolase
MSYTIDLARKIRLHALEMTSLGNSSHIGSILSMADIVAVLYGKIMNIDPSNPKWPMRDRFILSKGHAGAGIYAALAELGFFPISKLLTHYKDGSDLSGHISHKGNPGIELSTGSLGHGLSVAVGIAKAASLDMDQYRVFCLLGDGECDEGSIWEAALFAAHHNLSSLNVIVDYNKIQSLGPVSDTLKLEPFAEKWRSFGWEVIEVDGHDHNSLMEALSPRKFREMRPLCVLAHTIKGKGVSFMEHSVLWHYRSPQNEEYIAAKNELIGN